MYNMIWVICIVVEIIHKNRCIIKYMNACMFVYTIICILLHVIVISITCMQYCEYTICIEVNVCNDVSVKFGVVEKCLEVIGDVLRYLEVFGSVWSCLKVL